MRFEKLLPDNGAAAANRLTARRFFQSGRACLLVFLFAAVLLHPAGKAQAASFSNLEAFSGVWCVNFEKTKKIWIRSGVKEHWTLISVIRESYHMDVDFKRRTLIEGDIYNTFGTGKGKRVKRTPFTVKVKGNKLYMTIQTGRKATKTFIWVNRGDGTILHDIEGRKEEGPLAMERHQR